MCLESRLCLSCFAIVPWLLFLFVWAYVWRLKADDGNQLWSHLHLVLWGRASHLNPRLTDMTSLAAKLALGRPCLYHLSWNYRVTTMPTLHLCGFWGSEPWSSLLHSQYFNQRALSPAHGFHFWCHRDQKALHPHCSYEKEEWSRNFLLPHFSYPHLTWTMLTWLKAAHAQMRIWIWLQREQICSWSTTFYLQLPLPQVLIWPVVASWELKGSWYPSMGYHVAFYRVCISVIYPLSLVKYREMCSLEATVTA